jgi:hypothetical protein
VRARWFVSYMSEVRGHDGQLRYWPNSRIIDTHPLQWFASVLAGGSSPLVLTWWTPLTESEYECNTQVIDESSDASKGGEK